MSNNAKCAHCGKDPYDGVADIENAARTLWEKERHHCITYELRREGNYLLFPLPHCNTEWTFAVFDIAKSLVKQFPGCYIDHAYLPAVKPNHMFLAMKIAHRL